MKHEAMTVDTWVELLQGWASRRPDDRAVTFLVDGEREEETFTYAQLDARARAIATALREQGAHRGSALLLYPPGLEYVAAFFGCLYAGVTAVPAYPPDPARLHRTLPRLQAIMADAGVELLLTNSFIGSMMDSLSEQAPDLRRRRWLATDTLAPELAADYRRPALTGDSLAFLQYTSGSTGDPRGVVLTHRNLLENSEHIRRSFETSSESTAIIWLPPYHDMGLIGGILHPIHTGFPVVLMSPLSFLQRPLRWLEAVSRYRGTVSGGPNFAFDLCVRKSTPEERQALDLRSWDVAFCGAEPIRQETLERFAQAFAPSGLPANALYPCYGLAEYTLLVSGAVKDAPPVVRAFSQDALARGQAERSGAGRTVELVGCGQERPGQKLRVVDPDTGQLRPPSVVGEVWVSGPSVARGYWQRPQETARTFQAHLPGDPEPFLRTGDLGFLHEGELFITGRIKDLIIIRGRNHYPQDIEATVEKSHPVLRPGCVAAFSVEVEGEERLVIVQEVERRVVSATADTEAELRRALEAIAAAVSEGHDLQAHALLLVKPNSLSKTSSGKIQRHACKADYLRGHLEVLQRFPAAPPVQPAAPAPAPTPAAPAPMSEFEIAGWLQTTLARLMGVTPREVDGRKPITALGLDSLRAVELQGDIETHLGAALPLEAILKGPNLLDLAYEIAAAPRATRPAPPPPSPTPEEPLDHPLSEGQRALWFLQQLAPESVAYNVSRAVTLHSEVDVPALRRAFQALLDRHPALRARFLVHEGVPVQRIIPRAELAFTAEDASGWSEARLETRLTEEAHRPFDLEHGPLFRVTLLSRSAREHVLLLAFHHIAVDFWSLAVLIRELSALYTREHTGRPGGFPEPRRRYVDWVSWQQRMLGDAQGEAHWDYWRQALGGELPVMELLTDRPRPPVQTFRGASLTRPLDAALTRQLRALAHARGTTLFVTLLSAFYALLHRYTGQHDLIVGTPTAGRGSAEDHDVVGYFVNSLPLRVQVSGDQGFEQLLSQVRDVVLQGLAHQDYPFVRLVERLQPLRDPRRSPVFQVAFALQQAQHSADAGLEALAVEAPGATLSLGELVVESRPLLQRISQFELSLTFAPDRDGLSASFEYNSDLFDDATIARMGEHLEGLLRGLTAKPTQPLASLPMQSPAELYQVLREWNATSVPLPTASSLHTLLSEQAARTPQALAVVGSGRQLTYEELNQRANQLAHRLRALGAGPERLIALCFRRTPEALVALFGVLKSGAAFLMLDAHLPPERLEALVADARPQALILGEDVPHGPMPLGLSSLVLDARGESLAGAPSHEPEDLTDPAHLAYVMYTSGSTGTPKGVMVPHAAILHRVLLGRRMMPLTPADAVLQNTGFSFDVFLWEVFSALLSGVGARLVLGPSEPEPDISRLAELIVRERVSIAGFVPSVIQLLLEEPEMKRATSLRYIVSGGETLSTALRDRFLERWPWIQLHNLYGPAEATIDATAYVCVPDPSGRPVPIGRPLGNVQAYVLDERGLPSPVGIAGELFIGGRGLARGYLHHPELTAAAFIPHPFSEIPGERLYRTGDRVRQRQDGLIEFLGRGDHQVKIRGVRVELGEVEALLRQHAAVQQAVVLARPRGPTARLSEEELGRLLDSLESMSELEAQSLLQQRRQSPTDR